MKNYFAVILVIVAVFAGAIISETLREASVVDYTYNPSHNGFSRVDVKINGTTVHLSDGCYGVSFDVTQDQAYSIARGIEGTIGPRPLTHEIMKDILDNFGIKVAQVHIDRYENEIYYATIYMRRGDSALELDARPSDSMAIASRMNVPVYFKTDILQENGVNECGVGA